MSLTTDPNPIPENKPPQEPRKKKGWIYFVLVLMAVVLWWLVNPLERPRPVVKSRDPHPKQTGPAPAIPVVVGTAEKRNFPIYLNGLGTVQAFNSVTVHVRVDGELQQIFFQEGQTVQKGDVLAQIDPRPYQATYDQNVAKKAQDEAQLENAKVVQGRNEVLLKQKVIDQQTYDTQKYTVAQYQALVQADQAAIDNALTQLNYTRVVAPISGRVGIRLVDAGNIVHANDANGIVVINQVQPVSVVFTLPQQELKVVREALIQNQALKVIAVDRDNLSPLSEGVLAVMDNQIDPTTATVKLKATFQNTDYKLWPGQFVNVRLLVGSKPDALTVPSSAIQRGPDGTYVYLVTPESKAEMRTVKAGASEGGWTMVSEGLTAGEQIVVDGQYRLQPGLSVTTTTKEPTEPTNGSNQK